MKTQSPWVFKEMVAEDIRRDTPVDGEDEKTP
jgi:hypothetical protein